MKSDCEMQSASDDARTGSRAPRTWKTPAVLRLEAGAAEVGTRFTKDGAFSTS